MWLETIRLRFYHFLTCLGKLASLPYSVIGQSQPVSPVTLSISGNLQIPLSFLDEFILYGGWEVATLEVVRAEDLFMAAWQLQVWKLQIAKNALGILECGQGTYNWEIRFSPV